MHWALSCEPVRRRIAFEMKYQYFPSLEMEIPLTHNFSCPLRQLDALYSFTEIFVGAEYGNLLEKIPMPARWLDLGSHAGYFSLYLAWQHAVRATGTDYRALLVDADPRSAEWVNSMIRLNSLKNHLQYRLGAISKNEGSIQFALRSGMGSSADLNAPEVSNVQNVPVLTAAAMIDLLPPPYDLVKLDVEGAEFDFIAAYENIWSRTRHLVIEWHSWDEEGRGEAEIRELMTARKFRLEEVLKPKTKHIVQGRPLTAGIHRYISLSEVHSGK